jgi:[acyl-carrier-protein] S-malonyltransferase
VLVEPVASSLGWHVLRVEHITPAGRRPYDEVRADIAAELLGEARRRAFSVWLDRLVRETVQLMAGHEHPGDPASAEPSHRH